MLTDKRGIGFRDVLISPQPSDVTSRKEVSLERTFKFKNGKEITCIPIIASNMRSIGTLETAKVLSEYKILTCIKKNTHYSEYYETPTEILKYVIPTAGLNDFDSLWEFAQFGKTIKIVCLDVANGYMKEFVDFTKAVKYEYPSFIIMAGNVATAEGAERLYEAGADIVKVGLGSGSVCTTRFKTGVGVPQVSAIDDLKTYGGVGRGRLVCSDGGCTNPGDVAKAFVAGADFVMLGGLFAGTKETGDKFSGEAYKQGTDYRTSEGKSVQLPCKGSLKGVVEDILGGLRSCGSYIGQRNIEDFYRAELVQVNEQTNDIYGRPE